MTNNYNKLKWTSRGAARRITTTWRNNVRDFNLEQSQVRIRHNSTCYARTSSNVENVMANGWIPRNRETPAVRGTISTTRNSSTTRTTRARPPFSVIAPIQSRATQLTSRRVREERVGSPVNRPNNKHEVHVARWSHTVIVNSSKVWRSFFHVDRSRIELLYAALFVALSSSENAHCAFFRVGNAGTCDTAQRGKLFRPGGSLGHPRGSAKLAEILC